MTDEITADVDGRLRSWGARPDEIDVARRSGLLGLLAVTVAAFPGEPRYTAIEVAERVGIDRSVSKRLWRALGFPDVDDDARVFTDADVEAMATVAAVVDVGIADVELTVQLTRVLGSSMARVAEALVTSGAFTPESTDATDLLATAADSAVATHGRLVDYVLRRQLQAAGRRALEMAAAASTGSAGGVELAVGFADLVGFTAMSQQIDQAALADVVTRFEELAYDQVAAHRGRVVKMIGDEVMFVGDDAGEVVRCGLALAEAYAGDEVLSDVRVGIACGPVLARDADYFGPVVNLASRIVGIAIPGAVVVSEAVANGLAGATDLELHPLRPRTLKDIGRVRLFRVRRPR